MARGTMRLYNYHTNPETLYGYDMRHYVPAILSDLVHENGDQPEYRESIIASGEPGAVIHYYKWNMDHGVGVSRERWKEAEHILIQDPKAAVDYAEALVSRWPDAEPMIAKSRYAVNYTNDVINFDVMYGFKKRWKEAEQYIIQDAQEAALYSIMLYAKWTEAEPIIQTSNYWWGRYQNMLDESNHRNMDDLEIAPSTDEI